MTALIALLGGIRATVFAALALLLLAACGVQSYRLNTAQKALAIVARDAARTETARAKAETKASEAARAEEHSRAEAVNAAANAYEKGKQDGKAEVDRLHADVGAGALVLRDKFKCPASVRSPVAGSGVGDAAAPGILSAADQEFLVRLAAEADDTARQLSACQAVITADRTEVSP